MPIVGVNLDKILVEKTGDVTPETKVENHMSLKNITKQSVSFGSAKQELAKVNFEFSAKYEPKVGAINMEGHILYMDDKKAIDSIIKNWKDKKEPPKELASHFANVILTKCNVKTLLFSQEVNLPPNIRLPRVTAQEKPVKQTKKAKK